MHNAPRQEHAPLGDPSDLEEHSRKLGSRPSKVWRWGDAYNAESAHLPSGLLISSGQNKNGHLLGLASSVALVAGMVLHLSSCLACPAGVLCVAHLRSMELVFSLIKNDKEARFCQLFELCCRHQGQ